MADLDNAVQTYARALGADPSNEATQAQLERVALAANQAERLAQIYERQVGEVNDPVIASMLHVKAAQIRENTACASAALACAPFLPFSFSWSLSFSLAGAALSPAGAASAPPSSTS